MAAAPASGMARVLVVEDDESAAIFVKRVLERAGFAPSWVLDADQASLLLADDDFDVLLTDVRLPGRSGIDLVEQARSAKPAMPIAVMTSFNEVGLETRARARGADDFFEKPIAPTALVSRLTALARGSRRLGDGEGANLLRAAERRAGALPATTGVEADGHGSARRMPRAAPQVFRRIGRPGGIMSPVPLWASAAPVVSHIMSSSGPIISLGTSAAWTYPD